ncbi:unnamed protein product [Rotaria sordida]|uniref:Uncharacterized protein n=1 Tax=Rotaria sordida TaxID=392033 RepID=A0A814DIP1_9BILA|nr:unnamed protein product [Rotaria sordida]
MEKCYHYYMATNIDDRTDPFADLEYRVTNPKVSQDVINRNSGINILSKQPISKAVQLKAENYDLWFQNERLTEENGALGIELGKLQDKHDKLMYLARNRLGEIRSKYQRLEQDNQTLKTELDRLAREYETTKKIVEDYRRMEERFKTADREMRLMIDTLTQNDLLAKQLVSVNTKQKRLALELEKLKSVDAFMKNEEAMKMQDALMGLTDQLTQLRKMHANTLTENQRIKELLIEKDSVLTNLGYERHQLQDKMIKNEHTIRQMERMLDGNGGTKRSPMEPMNSTGQSNVTSNPYTFENVLES